MTVPEASRLGTIDEERRKRVGFLGQPDGSPRREFEDALGRFGSAAEQDRIRQVEEFARSLDYDHPGQSAEIYLAHPHRVAALYLDLVPDPTVEGASTCLVHNVLEVTDLDVDALASAVGGTAAAAVDLLTVDREQQWDPEYKRAYYASIAEAGPPAAPVKVVDKLDNLFMLHLNPSADVRSRYLAEIEDHLIPLARQATPGLVPYLEALVADNRAISGEQAATQGDGDG